MIVVGGGIGGLSAAFALARQGLRVRVLERARQFGEVGAGIEIAPNCTRILHEYGLLDEAKALGVLPENIVMRDALDARELTRLDLRDLERRYGFPYIVIHRSDLHGIFLRACQRAGLELVTGQHVVDYQNTGTGARVRLADGRVEEAALVIAADGLHSVARQLLVGDTPVNSAYVAYRGAVPIEAVRDNGVAETDVVVYIGPRCHFVQYPLRGGEMFNQVAVFESAKARACDPGLGHAGRARHRLRGHLRQRAPGHPDDVAGPLVAHVRPRPDQHLGARAHRTARRCGPPAPAVHGPGRHHGDRGRLGARAARREAAGRDRGRAAAAWDAALAAYQAVRVEHCRRVVLTARDWGHLWHLDGTKRLQRNAILRARDTYDYSFTDWIYGPTALTPDQEPALYPVILLNSVERTTLS